MSDCDIHKQILKVRIHVELISFFFFFCGKSVCNLAKKKALTVFRPKALCGYQESIIYSVFSICLYMTYRKESKINDGHLLGSDLIGDFKKSAELTNEYISS